MRRSVKNLKPNPSISDMLNSYVCVITEMSDGAPHMGCADEVKRLGLNKNQSVHDKGLTPKRRAAVTAHQDALEKQDRLEKYDVLQSKLFEMAKQMSQKDQQLDGHEIVKNKLLRAVNILLFRLEKREAKLEIREASLAKLAKMHEQAKMTIKALEAQNAAHKKAIKIYRDELKEKDHNIEALNLIKSKSFSQ